MSSVSKPEIPLPSEAQILGRWEQLPQGPTVSIVCVTYNHEHYLEDALKGFLSQIADFRYEILVHDDASEDKTTSIIREYKKNYPNLITAVIQDENQYSKGVKPATILYPLARGEFIALCEGDDYWCSPNKLSEQVHFMRENRSCSVSFHRAKIVHYTNEGLLEEESAGYGESRNFREDFLFFEGGSTAPTATLMFRRSLIGDFPKFFHLSPVGDMALKLLLCTRGRVGYIDEVMSVRRLGTPGSWNIRTRLNMARQTEYLLKMIDMLEAFDQYSCRRWHMDVQRKRLQYSVASNRIGIAPWINIWDQYPEPINSMEWKRRLKLRLRMLKFFLKRTFRRVATLLSWSRADDVV